ncbi:MAG: hypothetical protein ACFFED_08615 [Candidatus Thorarchaeota archaeon]
MLRRIVQRIERMTIREITVAMLVVTLIIPAAIIPGGGHYSGNEIVRGAAIVALLWICRLSYWMIDSSTGILIEGMDIVNPIFMLSAFIISIFNILFAIQVVRFCQSKSSKGIAFVLGILSLIFPVVFNPPWAYEYVLDFLRAGLPIYYGPIPIQLIIGLLIMRYAGPWKVTEPWNEEKESQENWWSKEDVSRKEES